MEHHIFNKVFKNLNPSISSYINVNIDICKMRKKSKWKYAHSIHIIRNTCVMCYSYMSILILTWVADYITDGECKVLTMKFKNFIIKNSMIKVLKDVCKESV